MCTHTYTHTYIHTYVRTYIHTYIHAHIHTYIHACTHAYIHTYIHMHRCKDASTDAYTYIRTCMHTYVRTMLMIMRMMVIRPPFIGVRARFPRRPALQSSYHGRHGLLKGSVEVWQRCRRDVVVRVNIDHGRHGRQRMPHRR